MHYYLIQRNFKRGYHLLQQDHKEQNYNNVDERFFNNKMNGNIKKPWPAAAIYNEGGLQGRHCHSSVADR